MKSSDRDNNTNFTLLIAAFVVFVAAFIYSQSQKPTSNTTPLSDDSSSLVGVWQDTDIMPAGWSNRYHFYQGGEYSFVTSQIDCTSRLRQIDGSWKIENNQLTLSPRLALYHQNGDWVDDPIECGSDKKLINYETVYTSDLTNLPIHQNINLNIIQDNLTSPPKMSFDLSGKRLWKFYDDPAIDAPAPIAGNTKSDEYYQDTGMQTFSEKNFSLQIPDTYKIINGDFNIWVFEGQANQIKLRQFTLNTADSTIYSLVPSDGTPPQNTQTLTINGLKFQKSIYWSVNPDSTINNTSGEGYLPSYVYLVRLPKVKLLFIYSGSSASSDLIESTILSTLVGK